MKRICLVLAVLMMCLPLCGLAQSLELAQPISGVRCYPEGVPEDQAVYQFRYTYPQFVPVNETDAQINAYYQGVAQDMTGVLFDQSVDEASDMPEMELPPSSMSIDYQISLNDDQYLSVLLTACQQVGNGESQSFCANTFARDGVYAGQQLTLSQVLGLEQSEATPEKSVAEALVYSVVWEIIQAQLMNVDGDYLDGVNEEMLEQVFSPETDFYLDQDGNLVFFIQAGVLAGEVAGVLTFPFAPAELLSAVNE